MTPDNDLYWKDYYKMESDESLRDKLIFSKSAYEKNKVAKELARREAEANERDTTAI